MLDVKRGTMERNRLLPINRFLCLYLVVIMTKLLGLPFRIEQSTTGFFMVAALLINKRTLRRQCNYLPGSERCNKFSSRVDSRTRNSISDNETSRRQEPLTTLRIGVVGGGLAGLSAAYHLLEKCPSAHITIIDRELPGMSR